MSALLAAVHASKARPRPRAGPADGRFPAPPPGCRQSPRQPAGQHTRAPPPLSPSLTFLMAVILPSADRRIGRLWRKIVIYRSRPGRGARSRGLVEGRGPEPRWRAVAEGRGREA